MFRILVAQRRAAAGGSLVALLALLGCSGPVSYNYASLPNPLEQPYRVKPGDVVHVRVLKNEATTGTYTVRPDGHVSLPLGGEIAVRNKTVAEVKQVVVKRLARYIEDAGEMVSVAVDQVRGVRYSVIGEVNRAGMFDSPSYVTVLEALANAGGLTIYAQPDAIYVLRRAGGKRSRIPVSYPRTVADPSDNRNFYLLAGDIVVVP